MKLAVLIMCVIVAISMAASMASIRQRNLVFPFFKTGPSGLCTAHTLVRYTTDVLNAVNDTPYYQNIYYTTKVFTRCPYTTIYRSQEETK